MQVRSTTVPVLFPACRLCVRSSLHTHARCLSSVLAEPIDSATLDLNILKTDMTTTQKVKRVNFWLLNTILANHIIKRF